MRTLLKHPARRRIPSQVFGRMWALSPGEEGRLQEFFHSHTLNTIHDRYGGQITTMTLQRARELVSVDQTRDSAFAIFSPDGDKILAVGRYCVDPDGHSAELAFVVREDMRRRGLATALLERLVSVA